MFLHRLVPLPFYLYFFFCLWDQSEANSSAKMAFIYSCSTGSTLDWGQVIGELWFPAEWKKKMQTSKADTAQNKFKLLMVPGTFPKLGEPELRQQLGLEVVVYSGGNTSFFLRWNKFIMWKLVRKEFVEVCQEAWMSWEQLLLWLIHLWLFGIHILNNSYTYLETKQYSDSIGKCFSTT